MPITFDQKMLHLVDQIRGKVPSSQKSDICADNISLMLNLLEVYDYSKDSTLKSLIKQLFDCVGNSWSRLLDLREANYSVDITADKNHITNASI